MAAPLSQDLRRHFVQVVEAGSSASEAARRFVLGEFAAIKLVRRTQKISLRAVEQDQPDVPEHGSMWRVRQRFIDLKWFVFIDKTSAATNMGLRYG